MIKPLQDYVVILPFERKRSDVLTVITSETDQGSWGAFAEVIAVGPGAIKKGKVIPLSVKVGDKICYGGDKLGCIKFPKVTEDGIDYFLIQEADICFIQE
jgi:co-chaperonin GroES (HSP10)